MPRGDPKAGRWLRACAGVLFPPACVRCGGFACGGDFEALCPECAATLEPADPPAAVRFAGAARDLVLSLKYRGRREVLPDIERIFRSAPEILSRAAGAVLVPVPLAPARLRERGFNQALLLAQCLARSAIPPATVRPVLRRHDGTPPQASLGREQRLANVKNAFALVKGSALNCSSRHLIIDDVTTTGSTLESCAHVLQAAGCTAVDAVAFAQG